MQLKRIGKWLFDFYLFGNLHIAACAVALTLVTRDLFGFHNREQLFIFIFCGTFFGYNIQRLPAAFGQVVPELYRHDWSTRHRMLLAIISGVAAGLAIYAFFHLYPHSQVLALLPAALSIAYAFPLIPLGKKWIKLRDIPGAKIFIIALVWLMSCALLPAAAAREPGEPWLTLPLLLWSMACGLLIFALTVPFDVRDIEYDIEQLGTLPARLGVKKSIGLALGALAVSAGLVWLVVLYFRTGTIAQGLAYSAWSVITGILIYRSTPERHEYYFSFVIDGMMIVLWAMERLAVSSWN